MGYLTYLSSATMWQESGRDASRLETDPAQLLLLRCWLGSASARLAPIDPTVKDWHDASIAAKDLAQPGWYERLLGRTVFCDSCSDTFRVENVAVCTDCLMTRCHACLGPRHDSDAPGNLRHHCGGEWVG